MAPHETVPDLRRNLHMAYDSVQRSQVCREASETSEDDNRSVKSALRR